MAILELFTRTDFGVYDYTTELDGVVYRVLLTYNTRAERWFLSLEDIDGNPLRSGIKLVSNWPLTTQWIQQGRPDGELYSTNPTDDDDADRDSLGVDSVLVYDEGNAFG